jgi:fused signal recognition particle receptor
MTLPLIIALAVIGVLLVGGLGFVALRGRTSPQKPPLEPSAPPPKVIVAPARPTAPVPTPLHPPASDGEVVEEVAQPEVAQPEGAQPEGAQPEQTPETASETEPEPVTISEPEAEPVRPRFRDRLSKARGALTGYFGSVLGRSTIDASTWDDLEEALIVADMGPGATTEILDDLKGRVKSEGITSSAELLEALKADLKKRLAPGDRTLRFDPGIVNVWLFVGVNGVGKTTTIGKLAKREVANGRTVIMAAGDTFRAAAAEQLGMWAERSGVDIVRGKEGSDPGAVIFDAIERAGAKGANLVLADTAGRLQTKTNLMEELKKIRRIADRDPGKVTETLLVLDATTGQNGLIQAEQFRETADITGVVLTKLDGTAKGGIAFAIQTKLGIPVKLVGLGEKVEDLVPFDPDEYVDALFGE